MLLLAFQAPMYSFLRASGQVWSLIRSDLDQILSLNKRLMVQIEVVTYRRYALLIGIILLTFFRGLV